MNKKDIQYIDNIMVENNKVQSLDMFKINLFNLNNIWYQKSSSISFIDNVHVYRLLGKMIENSKKSKNIIILPQNRLYRYDKKINSARYCKEIQLKEIISILEEQLATMFGKHQMIYKTLYYENTETKIQNKNIKAAFYFNSNTYDKALKSIDSEKITTISTGNLIFTTLNITEENMSDFIKEFFPELSKKNEDKPDWILEMEYFDDKENKEAIKNEEIKIAEANKIIEEKKRKLFENDYYKSILYSTGDQLVEVIFSILKKILGYNLNEFIDNKKEDFLLKFEDMTFIGEIKGIGTGVKSGNISQVDRHLQDYFDKLQEEDKEENLKGLLIINPQRNLKLSEREKVHETQIKLAIRNGSLIILTEDLLKLYEKSLRKELTNEEILNMLKNKIGLFSID